MHEKVSLRLMRELTMRSNDYDRGKAVGAEWASKNILAQRDTAPFTPDCENSRYNLGVLYGIVAELEQLAHDLIHPPSEG